jgi:4-amino-4-deoxy-L-arabinose transferase-like glycosyltransferase
VGKGTRLSSLVVIVIVVLLVRGVAFLVCPVDMPQIGRNLGPDGWLDISRNVVSGQGYTLLGTPTAFRGPTVIYFFAAALWLFGDNLWSIVSAQWLVDVVTAIVIFFIALEVFQDRRVAWVSSLLFALYGSGIIYTFRAFSEPLYTLSLAGFTLSLLQALRQPQTWRFALCGALLGLSVMARPSMQFYPLFVLPLLYWTTTLNWRQVCSYFAIFIIVFVAVLSPWVIRNYLIFDAFIPGSTHSGLPFYEGQYALDKPNYLRYSPVEESRQGLIKALEPRLGPAPGITDLPTYIQAKGLNEYEFQQIAFQEGVKIVRAFPGRYVIVSLVRSLRFWFGKQFVNFLLTGKKLLGGLLPFLINGTLLGLTILAFVCYRGSWRQRAIPIVALVVYQTAIYSATLAVGRYSVPITPYVMLFAALTVVHLFSGRRMAQRVEAAGFPLPSPQPSDGGS